MRCYNGAPDDELKALLEDRTRAHAEIDAAGFVATYFPAEEAYMVFDRKTHKAFDWKFYPTVQSAAWAVRKEVEQCLMRSVAS